MDASRKGALKKYQQDLRTGLFPGFFLPALHPLLTDVEYSQIRDKEDNVATVDTIIEILLTKENGHFEEFCAVLEGNGYEHWARTLREDVDQRDGCISVDVLDVDATVEVGAHGQCKLHKRSIKVNIDAITKMFKRGGKLIQNLEGFGTEVILISQKVLQALEEVSSEEIKRLYQVNDALHDLKSVVEIAYAFLDRVNDVFHCCQGNSMAAAKEGLSCLPPDVKPLRNLMSLLENSLKTAENKYAELVAACNKAIHGCNEAAQVCACKEREFQKKKGAARGIGGAAAGALMVAGGGAVAGGVVASVVAGVFTFGIGTVVGLGITAATGIGLGVVGGAAGAGTAAATHCIASHYKKGEASFRKIREGFDALLAFARYLEGEVAQVHTTQGNIAAQVNRIDLSLGMEEFALIKDTLERLNEVCTDSCRITSTRRDQVKSKMEELNAKIK